MFAWHGISIDFSKKLLTQMHCSNSHHLLHFKRSPERIPWPADPIRHLSLNSFQYLPILRIFLRWVEIKDSPRGWGKFERGRMEIQGADKNGLGMAEEINDTARFSFVF